MFSLADENILKLNSSCFVNCHYQSRFPISGIVLTGKPLFLFFLLQLRYRFLPPGSTETKSQYKQVLDSTSLPVLGVMVSWKLRIGEPLFTLCGEEYVEVVKNLAVKQSE